MKAVVFHGIGDIRLEDVPEPEIALAAPFTGPWVKTDDTVTSASTTPTPHR